MAEFKYGLCDCCGSMTDCLVGYFCPCVEASIAADNAGQGIAMTILQCFFYPLLVPAMRYQAREDRGIQGNIVRDLAAGWCLPCCASIQVKREFDEI